MYFKFIVTNTVGTFMYNVQPSATHATSIASTFSSSSSVSGTDLRSSTGTNRTDVATSTGFTVSKGTNSNLNVNGNSSSSSNSGLDVDDERQVAENVSRFRRQLQKMRGREKDLDGDRGGSSEETSFIFFFTFYLLFPSLFFFLLPPSPSSPSRCVGVRTPPHCVVHR
jgi:hypothetical protein